MRTKSSRRSRRARVKPQRILVPVDLSDSSVRALRHAAKLAAESGGSLTIIHVVPIDYGWLGIGREDSSGLDKSLQQQAADRLRALADAEIREDMQVDLEVRVGRPAEEIVAAAAESHCDLIVLSTHGRTGLDRYLIGSVADRVVRLAQCPVYLVRASDPSSSRDKQSRQPVLRLKHRVKRNS